MNSPDPKNGFFAGYYNKTRWVMTKRFDTPALAKAFCADPANQDGVTVLSPLSLTNGEVGPIR